LAIDGLGIKPILRRGRIGAATATVELVAVVADRPVPAFHAIDARRTFEPRIGQDSYEG
jgi:hypothetical protein